jgi:hypothetical protein
MVLTGSQPQARLSDMAICAGPPDVIAQGASMVLVQGLPAARKDDITAHGGSITLGFPQVLIGGPVFTARPVTKSFNIWKWDWDYQYGKAFIIEAKPGDPTYQSRVLAALMRLDSTPAAHAAMDAQEATGHTQTITPYDGSHGKYNATTTPDNDDDAHKPGVGTNSTIAWDPDVNGFGAPGTTPDSSQPGSDVILAHEMVHGVHNAMGTKGSGPINSDGSNVSEERNTVGLPAGTYTRPGDPLNGTPLPDTSAGTGGAFTENKIRQDYADRGIPSPVTGNPPVQRPSYYGPPAGGGPGTPF